MSRFAWWKGVSATAVCFALSVPAAASCGEDGVAPNTSSRRAAKIDAVPEQPEDSETGQALIGDDEPALIDDVAEGKLDLDLIQERYPNGAIKVERYMKLDQHGNYVRHGAWTMYEPSGDVLARGRYENGQRHGTFTRTIKRGESPLLEQMPFKECDGPFTSQAAFRDGRLHGKWIITDARKREISVISFENGQRSGPAVLRYADGGKMQEISYRDGLIEGEFQQWDADGQLTRKETYHQSRRSAASKISHYPSGQTRLDEQYLTAEIVEETPDDWWNLRLAVYAPRGEEIKHGRSIAWHENGQRKSQGEFKQNLPEGTFTWWHANGQKSMEGDYQSGKPHGPWLWWHTNGQKAIQGDYQAGKPVGKWQWWKEDGRLTHASHESPAESPVEASETPDVSKKADDKEEPRTAEISDDTPGVGSVLKR